MNYQLYKYHAFQNQPNHIGNKILFKKMSLSFFFVFFKILQNP